MFKLTVKIETGNAAFGKNKEESEYEIFRILRGVSENICRGRKEGLCFDTNGNRVGYWTTTESEGEE